MPSERREDLGWEKDVDTHGDMTGEQPMTEMGVK